MKDEEIDRSLAAENPIAPSPGFLASVMAAVRDEAATPPPIVFPWVRALPGLVAACAVLVTWAAVLLRGAATSAPPPTLLTSARWLASLSSGPDTAWILAAALLLLVAVRGSLRLAHGA